MSMSWIRIEAVKVEEVYFDGELMIFGSRLCLGYEKEEVGWGGV